MTEYKSVLSPTRSGKFYSREPTKDFVLETNFSVLIDELWFAHHASEILTRIGVLSTDKKRSDDLANMFDGKLSGFYYVAEASIAGSEEAIKWILGALAMYLNENSLSFNDIHRILPADYLRSFCEYLSNGKIERTFAKDIFADYLAAPHFETSFGNEYIVEINGVAMFRNTALEVEKVCSAIENDIACELSEEVIYQGFLYREARQYIAHDCVHRLKGSDILDKIILNPKYKVLDANSLDTIIDDVLGANSAQVEKAKTDPRVIQWFVGQVMKASKGKASAAIVQEKLKARF